MQTKARPTSSSTRPTKRAVLLFVAGLPVALLPALLGAQFWVVWPAYVGCALFACGMDFVLAHPTRSVQMDLSAPDVLFIQEADLAEGVTVEFTDDGVAASRVERVVDGDRGEPPVRRALGRHVLELDSVDATEPIVDEFVALSESTASAPGNTPASPTSSVRILI